MSFFVHLIKPTSIELKCRIITPMFLGDARQEAALRPEPFKGLLRYWWRVAAGLTYKSPKDLLKAESEIFGGGGEKAKKSLVRVCVEGNPQIIKDFNLPLVSNIRHPEVKPPVNPLLYLGYGPVTWDKNLHRPRYTRSYLAPGKSFTLKLIVPAYLLSEDSKQAETFKTALLYFRAFGAAGSRSRNGWGSFQVKKMDGCYHWDENFSERLLEDLPYWKDCFDKSYPHTLAKGDNGKLLLWKEEGFKSWEKAMKFLAEVYIYVRTGYVPGGYTWSKKLKLDPDSTHDIAERHLLGFPLTNHPAVKAGWGEWNYKKNKYVPKARLASPLRFIVRSTSDTYKVLVLHLPYYLDPNHYLKSNKKTLWLSKKQQIELWQKVHERLDQAMQRTSINDCL